MKTLRQLYPNGWIRLHGIWEVPNGSTFNLIVVITSVENDGGTNAYFYQWGAQLEEGSFPTSYIPTQGSTRTRSADDATITGKNFTDFINQEEGTLYIDIIRSKFTEPGNTFSMSLYSTNTNYLGLDYTRIPTVSGSTYWVNETGNPTQVYFPSVANITPDRLNNHKYAVSYKNNYLSVASFGNYPSLNAPTIPKPSFTSMNFNRRAGNDFRRRLLHYRRVTYYPKAFTPSQLQALTS